MNVRLSLFLALRNIAGSKKGGSSLKQLRNAVIGVFLSLIPLVVVLEVANGMIEGITRRYIEIGTYHLQARSFMNGDEGELDNAIQSIKDLEDVVVAIPVIQGLGLAYSFGGRTGITVRALPPDIYEKDPLLRKYLTVKEGAFNLSEYNYVLLSTEVAKKLQVACGDSIKILTALVVPGRPPILRPTEFTVQGIFSTGYFELDTLSAYISIEAGFKLFKDSGARFIGIKVKEPYNSLVKSYFDIMSRLPQGFQLYTWYEIEKSMYKAFETTKRLLLFIMVLIVCVASVNISSSLVMLVMEKRQEIAILKSAGTSHKIITLSYLLTGFFIGVAGSFFGLGGGLLVAVNINTVIQFLEGVINAGIALFQGFISPFSVTSPVNFKIFDSAYYLETIPIKLSFFELFGIVSLTVLLSTFVSYFPARKAGKLRPLDILQKH
ncbi:MAG: FtsX-like permease family protein [Spirochaetota bacterium]